eukprot:6202748-Pleurochrysis_carterae.AAC.1
MDNCQWFWVGGAEARSAMRATGTPELGERSASANASTHAMQMQWETVHANDEFGRATTIARIVRRARVKKLLKRPRGQNAR